MLATQHLHLVVSGNKYLITSNLIIGTGLCGATHFISVAHKYSNNKHETEPLGSVWTEARASSSPGSKKAADSSTGSITLIWLKEKSLSHICNGWLPCSVFTQVIPKPRLTSWLVKAGQEGSFSFFKGSAGRSHTEKVCSTFSSPLAFVCCVCSGFEGDLVVFGELTAHTLMATCTGERSGTEPALGA